MSNEREFEDEPRDVFMRWALCTECGERLTYEPDPIGTIYPLGGRRRTYKHKCGECGFETKFTSMYPTIVYLRKEE